MAHISHISDQAMNNPTPGNGKLQQTHPALVTYSKRTTNGIDILQVSTKKSSS